MSGSDVTPRLSSPVQSLVHEIPPKIKSQVSQAPFLGEEILACGSKRVRCEERQTAVSRQTRVETAERSAPKLRVQTLTGSLGREIAPPSVSGLHQLSFSFCLVFSHSPVVSVENDPPLFILQQLTSGTCSRILNCFQKTG